MEVIQQLNNIELEEIRDWCKSQSLSSITKSNYVGARLEKWFHLGSNLQNIRLGRARIFQFEPLPDFIKEIGNKHLPGWNSVLVCGGPTSIDWHRDHGHFEAPAIMINLGEASFREDLYGAGIQEHILTDGVVVKLNTKLLHASEQRSVERFNITFRTIKEQFLQ